ncbi:MAG: DinB family protein [Phycisphaerales bacterium]
MAPEFTALFAYSDASNSRVLDAAAALSDAALDTPLDIGPGCLRRILLHLYNGEYVWLARWSGEIETRWPSESEPAPVAAIAQRFREVWSRRDQFLSTLAPAAIDRAQTYRDSKGSLFRASLRDMLLQGLVHSIHHRAQAVNALRRLGGPIVELDYMMRLRQPA